ncbi:MAG: energy transducer TonB [Flavobacteriia bacterium]|nr:energy transducer TonB [Flavobacteriia bacterium]
MKNIIVTLLLFLTTLNTFAKDYNIFIYSNELEEYVKNVQILDYENNQLLGETDKNGCFFIVTKLNKNTKLKLTHPNFKDTTILFGNKNHSVNLKISELFKEKIRIDDSSIYYFTDFDTSNIIPPNITNQNLTSAEFIGGQSAFNNFIAENVKYPQFAIEQDISGKVYIKFIIEKDGSILHAIVMKSVSRSIDKEAIRVIKLSSKKWTPLKINDQPVRSYYLIPINFNIS